jgi:membrane protein YqaA with SNARE-associated domain
MDVRRKFAGLASRPDAEQRLFGMAVMEAMCIPSPSDFLLIPMAQLSPDKSFRYAFVAAAGSLVGAMVLFAIAWYAAILFVGQHVALDVVRFYAPVFILAAGFSGVPFNIVTILSGLALVNPLVFMPLVLITRALRFGFVSWLIWRSGNKYQGWLERSFNGMTLVVTLGVLVVSAIAILLFETA